MTSFLTGGLGGLNSSPRSPDQARLEGIDSQKLSYANKDFVKNIAWLNQSVDTLSQYTQKLQSGVDSANENALEQIQGFWGDLFVLFAGFEPTGIDVGDVKYVIQGLGAFFGINPDTPFPLNLVEAALHFLTTYIIPLDQFTDVIFDAILAWAEDFGLPAEFIDALHELFDAITDLTDNFQELFASLGDLLGAFGFLGFTSTSGLGDLWDTVMDLISGVAVPLLKPVLQILSTLGLPFIKALTAIVKTGSSFLDPLGAIAGGQVASLGANIAPIVSGSTLLWTVSGDSTNGWIVDDFLTASDISDGSFTTLGTGVAKRLLTQKTYAALPGQKFNVGAKLKWSGIPSLSNVFGIQLVWFNGATETTSTTLNIAGGHGATGGWTPVTVADLVVPENVDGFRIAVYVGTGISTGQVWVDDISVQLQGKIAMNLIEGIIDAFLGPNSPLSALNIFGIIPSGLLGLIGIGQIGNVQPNLLTAPGFDASDSISLGTGWIWDGTTGRTSAGCARASGGGFAREMVSNNIPVAAAQEMDISTWCKWSGIAYSGTTTPITLAVNRYMAGVLVGTTVLSQPASPATNNATWTQLTGHYTIPGDCDSIKVSFKVASNMTAGFIWWDDAEAKKTGLIQQSWVGGLLDSLGGLGDLIQGLLDALISVIRGIPFVGGVLADLLENFTGQTHTIVSTAATTDQILAALGPGNPDADDFERTNAVDLGAKWAIYKTGTGTIATPNGHDASFTAPGLTTGEFLAISNTKAAGNNQVGATVLGTAPGYDVSFFGGSGIAYNDIWLKVSDSTVSWATRTGLRCRIDGGKNIYLDWYNAGTPTNLYTGTFAITPTAGASFSLESGIGLVDRRHIAKLNGTPIMDFTEVGAVSQFGATYLRRAFGGKLDHSIFNPVFPGTNKQWTAQG